MRDALAAEPSTLFVCSAYHIGKERCYLGAAAAVGVRVYVSAAKRRVLELLELPPQHMALLSDHPSAPLHVGVCSLAPPELAAYLERQQAEQRAAGCAERSVWRRVVGFRATGWSYRASGGPAVQRLGDAVSAHGIPYSEHSSWHELRDCVRALRPRRLIPTVNAGSRAAQQAITDRLAALMDLSCDRGRIDAYLVPAAPGSSGSSSSGGASGGSGGASGTRPAPGAAAAYGGGAGGASPGQGGRKQQEEHEQQQQQQQQQSGEPCAACEQDETPRAACELQCDVWGSPEQGTLAADRAEAAALPAERGGEGSPDCSAGGQPQQPQQQVRQQVQQQHQQPQVQQQPCGGAAAGVEVDVAAAAAAPLDAAGLPGAAVAADQARDTHSRDQQDGRQQKQPEKQPPPPAKQQRQPPGAAGAADGTQLGWHVQLAGLPEPVDLAEQQRLLGDAERVKRLRHSLQLRQEAAAARKRRKAAAACAGRRR
jgi:DNA cross-link repair 1A protein